MDNEELKKDFKYALGGILVVLGVYTVYSAYFGDLPPSAATDGLEAIIEGVQAINETMQIALR